MIDHVAGNLSFIYQNTNNTMETELLCVGGCVNAAVCDTQKHTGRNASTDVSLFFLVQLEND